MVHYDTYYQAKKNALSSEVTVKVCGGYVNMDARDYRIWKLQK
mgnify:FL=1